MKKLYPLFLGVAVVLGAAVYAFSQSAIPGKETVTVPASDAESFESSWVMRFSVEAPSATEGNFSVYLQPYNATTGKISNPALIEPEVLRGEMWDLMAFSQSEHADATKASATAMTAVFAAVPEMRAYVEAKASGTWPIPEEKPVVEE